MDEGVLQNTPSNTYPVYIPPTGSPIKSIGFIPVTNPMVRVAKEHENPYTYLLSEFKEDDKKYGPSKMDPLALFEQLNKYTNPTLSLDIAPAFNLLIEFFTRHNVHSERAHIYEIEINADSSAGAFVLGCRTKAEYMSRYYESDAIPFLENPRARTPLWTASQKDEVMTVDKIADNGTRLFNFSNAPAFLFESKLCQLFNKKLYKLGEENTTIVGPGITLTKGGLDKMCTQMEDSPYIVMGDLSRYDKSMSIRWLQFCRDLRVSLYNGKDLQNYKEDLNIMYEWLTTKAYHILPGGQVVLIPSGNKSGCANTTGDNQIVHMAILFLYCYYELRMKNLDLILDEIRGKLYSDDQLISFKTHGGKAFNKERFILFYKACGFILKPDLSVQTTCIGLTFLGVNILKFNGSYVGAFDESKFKYILLHDRRKLSIQERFEKAQALQLLGRFTISDQHRKTLYMYMVHLKTLGATGIIYTDDQLYRFWTGAESSDGEQAVELTLPLHSVNKSELGVDTFQAISHLKFFPQRFVEGQPVMNNKLTLQDYLRIKYEADVLECTDVIKRHGQLKQFRELSRIQNERKPKRIEQERIREKENGRNNGKAKGPKKDLTRHGDVERNPGPTHTSFVPSTTLMHPLMDTYDVNIGLHRDGTTPVVVKGLRISAAYDANLRHSDECQAAFVDTANSEYERDLVREGIEPNPGPVASPMMRLKTEIGPDTEYTASQCPTDSTYDDYFIYLEKYDIPFPCEIEVTQTGSSFSTPVGFCDSISNKLLNRMMGFVWFTGQTSDVQKDYLSWDNKDGTSYERFMRDTVREITLTNNSHSSLAKKRGHNKTMHALNGNTTKFPKIRQGPKDSNKKIERLEQLVGEMKGNLNYNNVKNIMMNMVLPDEPPYKVPTCRYAETVAGTETAVASPQRKLNLAISGTTDGTILSKPDFFAIFRRDPYNSLLYYDSNVSKLFSQYDIYYENEGNNTVNPPSRAASFDAAGVRALVPLYAVPNQSYAPHGPCWFPMRSVNGLYYFYLGAQHTYTIIVTNNTGSNQVITVNWYYDNSGQDHEVGGLSTSATTGTNTTFKWIAATAGYYAVKLYMPTAGGCVLYGNISNNTSLANDSTGKATVAHLPAMDIQSNFGRILGVRTLAVAGMVSNFTNLFNVSGMMTGMIVPGERSWVELFNTKDSSKLNGSITSKLIAQEKPDNGMRVWVPPVDNRDFDLNEHLDFRDNVLMGSYSDLYTTSNYGVIYYTNNSVSTLSVELYSTMRLEYLSEDQWTDLRIGSSTKEEWDMALECVRKITDHITENPIHWYILMKDVLSKIGKHAGPLGQWISNAANNLNSIV